jgi:D-glycero-D-manno-heptose 1,7-bisphosphate phosphatase
MKESLENIWYDGNVPPSRKPEETQKVAADRTGGFVLLDRDGVINRDLPKSVRSLDEFEVYEQAARALGRLRRAGVTVAVITNQACVGRGELSVPELNRIHERMSSVVEEAGGRIDAVFACLHRAEDRCDCRKPKPGLLQQAQKRYAFEPRDVWLVGDDVRDIEAAEAFGCNAALVLTGKGKTASVIRPDIPNFADLEGFVEEFLGRGV